MQQQVPCEHHAITPVVSLTTHDGNSKPLQVFKTAGQFLVQVEAGVFHQHETRHSVLIATQAIDFAHLLGRQDLHCPPVNPLTIDD